MTMRDYDDPPRPADLEPLALEYRPERPADGDSVVSDMAVRLFRRGCFAIGLALLAGGYGSGMPGRDVGTMMGWGGFLVGLAVPLGRRPQG